jgi:chemotaxis protein methyltransferase CheR
MKVNIPAKSSKKVSDKVNIDASVNGALVREFLFTDRDFEQIRKLIYEHAGINLSSAKKDMVYSRLGRRLRATGLKTFKDYIALLATDNNDEWESFVNSLTTNLTSFFREAHHFPVLAGHVRSLKNRSLNNPINIWCNAASTGEEPYTIAMTMMDVFDSLTPPVRIIATDIDTQALQKAKNGVYSLEQAEKLPKDILERFFLKGRGEKQGQVKVRQELCDLIAFKQLNLQDANWPIKGPFDAIFCRNVMIYFDRPTQHKILQRFAPIMQRDALLFAGHSESLQGVDAFKPLGKTVYGLADQQQLNTNNSLSGG